MPRGEHDSVAGRLSVRDTCSVYSQNGGVPRVQYGSAKRLSVRTVATAQRHTPPTGGPTYTNRPSTQNGFGTAAP